MRTKTNEKKRYSLRTPKKIVSIINDDSENESPVKKSKFYARATPLKETVPIIQTRKAKRKSAKPTKSVTKEDDDNIPSMVTLPSKQPACLVQIPATPVPEEKPCISMATQFPESPTVKENAPNRPGQLKPETKLTETTATKREDPEVVTTTVSSNSNSNQAADFPVYTALEHAIHCRIEKGCMFQKCAIAKQFLSHSSSCNEKIEDCTICKAMDIMVCKHAEKCETPLDKSCPIPNCNHVRHLMMEEWLKFKSNHHEIVSRAFTGLLHARKCKDKACQSNLCKNIKLVLQHTQTCKKHEACKTRRLIVQLCEYHQDTCTDERCQVEFCVENRQLRAEEASKKQKEQQQQQQQASKEKHQVQYMCNNGNTKPISNLGVNNLVFPNGFPGLLNMQQIASASAPEVGSNLLMPNTPQMVLPYSYVNWPNNAAPNEIYQQQTTPRTANEAVMKHDNTTAPTTNTPPTNNMIFSGPWNVNGNGNVANVHQQQPNFMYPGWPYTLYGTLPDNSNQHNLGEPASQTGQQVSDHSVDGWLKKNEKVGNLESKRKSPGMPANPVTVNLSENIVEENEELRNDSLTAEMYYQLWPMKGERIDQKSHLPRLSPNELQSILTREDNSQILSPVHDNRAQFSEAPFLLNDFQQQNSQDSVELEESPIESANIPSNSYQSMTSEDVQVEKMGELMKEQEEWSKIDFVKEQNIENGYEVETETGDEAENDNIYNGIISEEPDTCYFLSKNENAGVDDENGGGCGGQKRADSNMTALERNFLTILKSSTNDNDRTNFA